MESEEVTIEAVGSGSRCGVPYTSVRVSSTTFDLPSYLTVTAIIGRGANGMVVSALDSRTSTRVAVKKLRGALSGSARDNKRVLWEVRLLRGLQHENLMGLLDLLLPSEQCPHQCDIYLVMPLLESDLHRIITSGQPLTDQHVQFFVYQLLLALKYLHSAGVIHRDVKPSNVLLNSDCAIKLGDYGLSRPAAGEDMTEYVVTRWYRAPEVMLDSAHYGPSMDLWGLGCVMAELLGRRALFPGKDYMDLLALICSTLGSPSEDSLGFISNGKAKEYLRRLPQRQPVPLATLFPGANPAGLDLLQGLLQFNPAHRLTAVQALQHPYLASLHSEDPVYEPVCAVPIDLTLGRLSSGGGGGGEGGGKGGRGGSSSQEAEEPQGEVLRQLLWEEARRFRPELPPLPPPLERQQPATASH